MWRYDVLRKGHYKSKASKWGGGEVTEYLLEQNLYAYTLSNTQKRGLENPSSKQEKALSKMNYRRQSLRIEENLYINRQNWNYKWKPGILD